MQKTDITLKFETEKLDALSYFLGKRNVTPQQELERKLDELYMEHVPADTREYLDSKANPTGSARYRPKRLAKPVEQKQSSPAGDGSEQSEKEVTE